MPRPSVWPDWPCPALLIHGPEGSGKTHLARIWAALAGGRFVPAIAWSAALEAARESEAPLAVALDDADQIADDLELTQTIDGGTGELLKDPKKCPDRTHISDAVGYHVAREHPVVEVATSTSRAA